MDNNALLKFLRHYFDHSDFKNDTQKNAILTILRRNADVFVSFPSGYGRTMCYQLPSLIYWNKMTVVIIPHVTRIMDHVNKLRRLKIQAEVISTLTTPNEKTRIYVELQSVNAIHCNFLYVTPDQVSTLDFKLFLSYLIRFKKLSYIVVDETHCENQWIYGQKNNEYYALGKLRKECMDIPWIVVTATAGVDVIDFLRRVLYIKDDPTSSFRFSIPSYRRNIFYDVALDDIIGISVPHLTKFLDRYLNGKDVYRAPNSGKPSGLIFCKTRQVTEQLVKELKSYGILIAAYHAGLEETDRNAVKDSFMNGYYQILAVTSTSGMEINKPNIRLVIHWGMPSSISAYYHESGQAGKDGHPARCRVYLTKQSTLYYNPENEAMLADAMIPADTLESIQKTAKSFLVFLHSRYMKDYCEGLKCRHRLISDYFGDGKMECIDSCDICSIVSHDYYGGRGAIRTEILQMGLTSYMKHICSKYHDLEKNNMLTTKDALNIMKVCDELARANYAENPEARFRNYREFAELEKLGLLDLGPSTSCVENDDKKDKDELPSS
ncbi:ATP-dependent DNA helicase Q5-like [Rhopalosiphum padi]|uniref:ATP-dependent DNA helicase Q5-like n=1 Tax=Rhopalosiphum padi TaxID=40932 RepID=UPI00298DFF54|nr:ATP-dependent DNA helicase Q5-like [Rhopalosiphum padi]